MKVNKLQIGDYVNYRGQIIKVTSLYDKGGSNEVGWSDKESVWVNADNVEPIPLTPEILEKNGFEKALQVSDTEPFDTDEEGNTVAPSFIMEKASKMFGEEIRPGDVTEAEMSALSQVTELAANSLSAPGEKETAAAEYLRRNYPSRLETLQKAAGTDRGSLSSKSVRQLYGSSLKLNPTRADTYVKCAYAYFCKYGLKTSKDGEQEMDAAHR